MQSNQTTSSNTSPATSWDSRKSALTNIKLLGFILLLSGCATLFTGTDDDIRFESDPAGAMVFINGIEKGTTPTTVSVKRSINDVNIALQLDGYETRQFVLEKEFNKASFFNLFNVLFWAVDAVSGSLMKHAPQYYEITLRPNGVVQQSTDVDLYRADTLDSNENGALIIPASSKQTIAIIDGMPGYTLVFERK
ncbi:MAG: PEGA domain-containing protein [Balneolaceae bacterium]|nr:PEGA domain-containing protein [Balneolaceae bacterium]MDR9447424.1 PEGA domain-containing protein [Balneolaceae bacterium]